MHASPAADARGLPCPFAPASGVPPPSATGDHPGLTGGGGGASDAYSRSACTTFPSTIVSTDDSCGMRGVSIVK
ncbi:hypothetical protein BCO37747_08013 [Burkholderia contaminans]|nr:hypothetical protein BCO23253_07681 [Burkholderia contaminans]VWD65343.1 hypothetical protein BCO37747_08013 [Burkholderia contaminans]